MKGACRGAWVGSMGRARAPTRPTVAEGKDWPGWSCGRAAKTGAGSTKGGQGHARETHTQTAPLSTQSRPAGTPSTKPS